MVHLGDYIYETTGDPLFQGGADERALSFDDEAGAIVFNEGTDDEYFAAKSLDNYRQLYRIYRSDPALQTIHERYPVVMMWDDHEFTNDSHGATGTYFGGFINQTKTLSFQLCQTLTDILYKKAGMVNSRAALFQKFRYGRIL